MNRTFAAPAPKRRGRPYRPPVDTTPYDDVVGGGATRVAWLLGTTRLHARGGTYASRRHFVVALNDRGVVCDEPRVSRWESGGSTATIGVIRAYEDVLGLTPYSLVAVAAMTDDGVAGSRVATSVAPMDVLLDATLDGAPTGADWLELVGQLAAHPSLYMRADTWTAISEKLVSELCRSTGAGYTTRRYALRSLVTHPAASPHVVRAIEGYVADPCAQRSSDVIALLQHLPAEAATSHLLALLEDERPSVQRGAARAVAALLARGSLAADAALTLEHTVRERLAADPMALHLADVARQLPCGAADRIRAALGDDPLLGPVVTHSELLPADTSELVSAGVALAAQSKMTLQEPDPMLARLVREALFHSNGERRSQASSLLLASPYRAGLSRACASYLDGADADVSGRLARLLRYCIDRPEFPLALGAAIQGNSPAVRHNALRAIGHVPVELTAAQAMLLVNGAAPWDDAMVVDGTLYALGMHGHADLAGRAVPGLQRVSDLSAWWLRHGGRVPR